MWTDVGWRSHVSNHYLCSKVGLQDGEALGIIRIKPEGFPENKHEDDQKEMDAELIKILEEYREVFKQGFI